MRLLFMVYRFCRSTTLVIVCADCDARGVGWEFGWGCIGWLLLPKCQAECFERLRVHRATLPNPRSPASPSCVFSPYVTCLSSICIPSCVVPPYVTCLSLICAPCCRRAAPCCRLDSKAYPWLVLPSHPWVQESATGGTFDPTFEPRHETFASRCFPLGVSLSSLFLHHQIRINCFGAGRHHLSRKAELINDLL